MHPAVAMLATEWGKALKEKREPDAEKVTAKHLDRYCKYTAVQFPDWPKILSSSDLSKYALGLSADLQWWILEEVISEDSNDGTH